MSGCLSRMEKFLRDCRTNVGTPGDHCTHSRDNLLGSTIFEDVALAAQAHCAAKEIFVSVKREKDDLCIQLLPCYLTGHSQPVELRHVDIENSDLRTQLFYQRQGHLTVRGFSDYLKSRIFFHTETQPFTHDRMIICDQ